MLHIILVHIGILKGTGTGRGREMDTMRSYSHDMMKGEGGCGDVGGLKNMISGPLEDEGSFR